MNPFVRKVFGGTLVLLVLAIPAFGQISTAQLSGKVTDTSNAVLPGATITVTQAETRPRPARSAPSSPTLTAPT
ncbi:MAG TPA: hypothetical protein VKC35_05610 [Vicinamibacterales bacterium]|nr:hypothetical protein [Vicinamibacterales bacterium]